MVIYSSNIFAVLGLRSLFFLLRGAVDKFEYLPKGIAVVLVFIGAKMLLEYFDIRISIYISLIVIVVCLVAAILFSMSKKPEVSRCRSNKKWISLLIRIGLALHYKRYI